MSDSVEVDRDRGKFQRIKKGWRRQCTGNLQRNLKHEGFGESGLAARILLRQLSRHGIKDCIIL